jgi:hypothetical protein
MESNGHLVADGELVRAALADGLVAVGEFDPAGLVAHEFDDSGGSSDFVGVRLGH